jgi:NAD(P)-dependent dehydrogenase (short-subunit alcohol dehydrogenase family)
MTRQTVIITGASRGLGAATANVAAELGANVVLAARSADQLAEHVDHIRNVGGAAIAIPGDVSLAGDCQQLVEKTLTHFGRIDSIVNNAGSIKPIAPVSRADVELWRQNLDVNFMGPLMLTQATLSQLRLHRGRIINVSSGASINAIPGLGAHCAAKAALTHFSRVLATEEEGITTIAFRPGVIDTQTQTTIREEGVKGMPPEAHARFMQYYQQGELLPPQVPGGALAILALYAPAEWSGQFLAWDDPRIQQLRLQFSAGH